MSMEYDDLRALRRLHPGWRLLAAEHGPMVAAFLHRCFLSANERAMAESELCSRLEDFLFHLRRQHGEDQFPRAARAYLDDWAGEDKAWLRKYYPRDSDEPHYDLTPATEKALQWLAGLQQPRFVGAESRLMTVFELLREIRHGTETDPEVRLVELEGKKAAIEAEIEQVRAGDLRFMDETRLRERFLQMADTARGLLADFRQVEQNFRDLDRKVREKVATSEGGKGEMLEEIFGDRDAIADSDQGRSFRAFWDFLMSPARQEELSELLEWILSLPPVRELRPDGRLARVHYDWLEAGEVTQRTVARLSEQLRQYLDDQAWLENRRIMELIRGMEQHALALRGRAPDTLGMALDEPAPAVELPMERPLFQPPVRPHIEQERLEVGEPELAADALFEQVYVDRQALRARVRRCLQSRDQVSLPELLDEYPLELGLAELVGYLGLASEDDKATIDETGEHRIAWKDGDGNVRSARVPRVIFTR